MQKVFENGSEGDNREILIIIGEDIIEFYHYQQYLNHKKWVKEEIERRNNNGQDDLDEDEKADNTFYWIDKQHWIKDKKERLDRPDNWHNHMAHKRWFTGDMADFINMATS